MKVNSKFSLSSVTYFELLQKYIAYEQWSLLLLCFFLFFWSRGSHILLVWLRSLVFLLNRGSHSGTLFWIPQRCESSKVHHLIDHFGLGIVLKVLLPAILDEFVVFDDFWPVLVLLVVLYVPPMKSASWQNEIHRNLLILLQSDCAHSQLWVH